MPQACSISTRSAPLNANEIYQYPILIISLSNPWSKWSNDIHSGLSKFYNQFLMGTFNGREAQERLLSPHLM